MDLAQIQREGKLTSSYLVDVLVPFKGEPGFVKHINLSFLGASMGPPFMTIQFIMAITSANTLMAKYTNKEVSYMLAVYQRFPLMYWLKAHHSSVRMNIATSII